MAPAEDLEDLLAGIDEEEQKNLRPLIEEVYVGFAVLGPTAAALAIGPEEPEPEPPPREWLAAMRRENPVDPYMQRWREEGGAVPPVIARCLGDEGCRMLARGLTGNRDSTGDEILTIHIPSRVRYALEKAEREASERAGDLVLAEEACAQQVASEVERREQLEESEADAWREWERMHVELAVAKAQVTALHEVISRNFLNKKASELSTKHTMQS